MRRALETRRANLPGFPRFNLCVKGAIRTSVNGNKRAMDCFQAAMTISQRTGFHGRAPFKTLHSFPAAEKSRWCFHPETGRLSDVNDFSNF